MEDITTNIPQENTNEDIQKYLDTINELKNNTVSRAEYEKIRTENKQLLTTLVEGRALENSSTEDTSKPTAAELRKELYSDNSNLTNLDYWQKTLDLRDLVIKETGKDPFLPYGKKIAPTAEDVEAANRVAEVVRECIDYADGDSRIFTNELDRRTIDTAAPVGRRRR